MIRTRTIKYWNFTAHFHWMELGVWREKWAVHFTVSTLIMPKDIKKEKTDWTNARKSMFIEIMLEQVRAGENCDSNGFKSKLWLEIMKGFNMTAEVDYDKQQLQSQYSIMKKQYLIFRTLYDKSGFGWDDENKVPTAPIQFGMNTLNIILKLPSTDTRHYLILKICVRYFQGNVPLGDSLKALLRKLKCRQQSDLERLWI
jgi:hypothetical protein